MVMTIYPRQLLGATAAAPLPGFAGTARAKTKRLKISHLFHGGTIDSGETQMAKTRESRSSSEICYATCELHRRIQGAPIVLYWRILLPFSSP
jgi:hypothetical protein